MYLLYIDDAGTIDLKKDESCALTGGNTRFFVLGAILIKANELNKVEPIFQNLKIKCLSDEFAELKHSQSKKLNCINSCQKETIDKDCHKKIVATQIAATDCVTFAITIDKYSLYQKKSISNKDDIYKICFETLLSYVDLFMYENKISESTICFIDHKNDGTAKDDMIYKKYQEVTHNPKIFRSFKNKIFSPTINIVNSRYTLGCQLADFVAGSTWKALETFYEVSHNENAPEFKKAVAVFNLIREKKFESITYGDSFKLLH